MHKEMRCCDMKLSSHFTYPDGMVVTYEYNGHDRLASLTDYAGRTTTYEYDEHGDVTNRFGYYVYGAEVKWPIIPAESL